MLQHLWDVGVSWLALHIEDWSLRWLLLCIPWHLLWCWPVLAEAATRQEVKGELILKFQDYSKIRKLSPTKSYIPKNLPITPIISPLDPPLDGWACLQLRSFASSLTGFLGLGSLLTAGPWWQISSLHLSYLFILFHIFSRDKLIIIYDDQKNMR